MSQPLKQRAEMYDTVQGIVLSLINVSNSFHATNHKTNMQLREHFLRQIYMFRNVIVWRYKVEVVNKFHDQIIYFLFLQQNKVIMSVVIFTIHFPHFLFLPS